MRTQLVFHYRTSALAFCLIAAAALAGCASKNPLIDDGAPATPTAAKPADPSATADAAAQPVAVGSANAVTDANKGVQATAKPFLSFLSPYKIDIQQGNFVSAEMLAQLKEGMTRSQVRFVLGTPQLTDIFHSDRWDYDFRLHKGNGQMIASRVTVFFNGDSLTRWEGGNLPTESEYLGLIAGSHPDLPESPSSPAPSGRKGKR
ncbi:MAG: smpA / OmlA family protein [Herbaspirillum sp.]|jgi:outer membrane protein assembly factor BamE|nr:smpA / OmlA family protein [Herbaspirillum sp.]